MPSRVPHDFLLQASELISRASIIDTANDGWPEEEAQPSHFIPPVPFRRRAGLEGSLLTRTYTGRPHIPGEDSGSETDDDQILPYSPTNLTPSSPSEPLLTHLPTQLMSSSNANLRRQSTHDRASQPPRSRPRLQSYNNNQTRRPDDELVEAHSQDQGDIVPPPSYGTITSRTPIRARRAPPRPHFAHSIEETINRAAVFERRLERALREYRTARRAWTTSSNPHTNSGENESHSWTTTPASTTMQATTTLTEDESTERNSVHDVLRSVRRQLHSSGRLTTPSAFPQRVTRLPLESSHPTTSSQNDTTWRWWRRESENHSLAGTPDPNDSSSTYRLPFYARLPRPLQSNQPLSNTTISPSVPYNSRPNHRNYADGQSDRLHHPVQRTGPASSSPFLSGLYLNTLGDSRLDIEHDSPHRRATPVQTYALSATEMGEANQRRSLHDGRSARNGNGSGHRNDQQSLAVLKFLARLREDALTREQARDLATKLGIHNQNLERDSQTDLVMSLDEMPDVEYTSWLEPGLTWTGLQYADTVGDNRAPAMIQDQLTVKVILHSVDWDKMTITGTMLANHSQRKQSTESFFTGEIIDFRQHGLDTYCTRWPRRYTSFNVHHSDFNQCGSSGAYQDLEMDLLHWPMLGPFKRDIDRALGVYQHKNQQDRCCHDSGRTHRASQNTDVRDATGEHANRNEDSRLKPPVNSETGSSPNTGLTADEIASIKLNRISDQLSSARWLQSNLNQAGWILMRWKEQCFMPSTRDIPSEPEIFPQSRDIESSDRTSPMSRRVWTTVQSERESLNSTAMSLNESNEEATRRSNVWGLSIDGFYYVALNRQTGEIEALYHDPGSVLYQKLEMKPSPSEGDLGMRSNFSLVEFR